MNVDSVYMEWVEALRAAQPSVVHREEESGGGAVGERTRVTKILSVLDDDELHRVSVFLEGMVGTEVLARELRQPRAQKGISPNLYNLPLYAVNGSTTR
jgi:hypothetical protein